jgi:hypothetical protein
MNVEWVLISSEIEIHVAEYAGWMLYKKCNL